MKRFNIIRKFLSALLTASILCNSVSAFGYSAITAYDTNGIDCEEFLYSSTIGRSQTCSLSNNSETLLNKVQNGLPDIIAQENNYVNYVAILQIFAWDGQKKERNIEGSISTAGHAFIVITNNTYSYINAGGLAIEHGTGITIGTWQNEEHDGLWYGLEGYNYKEGDDDFEGSCSMTMKLTLDQLKKINNLICENDQWYPWNNCSSFASKIWNEVASEEDKINPGFIDTPTELKKSIVAKGSNKYKVNAEIPTYYSPYYGNPPKKSTYYY